VLVPGSAAPWVDDLTATAHAFILDGDALAARLGSTLVSITSKRCIEAFSGICTGVDGSCETASGDGAWSLCPVNPTAALFLAALPAAELPPLRWARRSGRIGLVNHLVNLPQVQMSVCKRRRILPVAHGHILAAA